jgi:hypothetical protein
MTKGEADARATLRLIFGFFRTLVMSTQCILRALVAKSS